MTPDFQAIRGEFPTLDNWVYLDTTAKAPLPKCAEEAMHDYMRDMWERVGESAFSAGEIEKTRAVLGSLLGVSPTTLTFIKFDVDDKWKRPLALAPDARRFEYGNPNYLGLWVMRRSLELIQSIGLAQIEARVRDLTTYLYDRVEDLGITVTTPQPWSERAGILSFNVPEPETVRGKLLERKIVVNVRDGRALRTATHFFNTRRDIDILVEALNDIARKR